MIPLSKILKDSESVVIRRVKRKSFPSRKGDFDVTVKKESTPEKDVVTSSQRLHDIKSGRHLNVEKESVIIRKKVKK